MKIAKKSISWILSAFFAAVIFSVLFLIFLNNDFSFIFLFVSFVMFIKTIFFIVFFRDPERNIGKEITSCADGKIREISEIVDKEHGKFTKVSTFMNIYNVHVNRAPIDGKVESISHFKGSHIPAFKKESERNERVEILLKTKIGSIKIFLIAGTVARRIVPYIRSGDELIKGERIGIIRFGSRVDLYIPTEKIKSINVKVGDKIKAGETTIAKIND